MGIALEDLRPIRKRMIIECVQSAGIDVRAWGFRKKDGQPVTRPQSNGGYCYEWSFRSVDGSILLSCVWFEEIGVDSQGRVCFVGNLRAYADALIRQLEKDPKNRNRTIKDPRISRAQHFNATVQLAHLNSAPMRVVIVSGPVREKEDEGDEFDRAIGRQLDDLEWFVESFDDDTGAFVLVRGNRDQGNVSLGKIDTEGFPTQSGLGIVSDVVVADQFATDERPDTYTYKGVQRYRDPSVRRQVLERSEGGCELTEVPGFRMANGGVYLETHHIIPLSEGGPDTVENVIALSANAHRQAHFGAERDQLRERCLEVVAAKMKRHN
ncbi:HNH endonuclease signature motif containing protein [Pseudomonas sp. PD9R]|uniref:HNH endonuclease signature motif containing protein n=1 Tax=Pseudomonas sp. PD9R TaxID=2853534 RepID=UPI001C4839E8|nr:HNH endonuclease signature motif containing protein [Pseudomonas sp. PD9R]MBV6821452.1 HNH endonuclease [Pseudomonas sp. PD9R]